MVRPAHCIFFVLIWFLSVSFLFSFNLHFLLSIFPFCEAFYFSFLSYSVCSVFLLFCLFLLPFSALLNFWFYSICNFCFVRFRVFNPLRTGQTANLTEMQVERKQKLETIEPIFESNSFVCAISKNNGRFALFVLVFTQNTIWF